MFCGVAARLLDRAGTQLPRTAPSTPLSFGSPVHDLTPQRTPSVAAGGEAFGSTSESARWAGADLLRHLQMTRSVDDTAARRKQQQARGECVLRSFLNCNMVSLSSIDTYDLTVCMHCAFCQGVIILSLASLGKCLWFFLLH